MKAESIFSLNWYHVGVFLLCHAMRLMQGFSSAGGGLVFLHRVILASLSSEELQSTSFLFLVH